MKISHNYASYDLTTQTLRTGLKKNTQRNFSMKLLKLRFADKYSKITKPYCRIQTHLSDLKKFITKSNKSSRSIHGLYNYQHNLVMATTVAMQEMGQNTRPLQALAKQLEASKFKADRPFKSSELRMAKNLRLNLLQMLTKNYVKQGHSFFQARKLAAKALKNHQTQYLNNKNWTPINTTITYNNTLYKSEQLPACKMKLSMDDIFPVSYANKGVSSSSATDINHSTNLWKSSISTFESGEKKVLFSGIRHGVLSPYSLAENSPERTEGAKNRAREVVSAALFSKPELLKEALEGKTVPLKLVSTALLTNTTLIANESGMLQDQLDAFASLSKGPLTLAIRNSEGKMQNVTIDLDVTTFNFGVNELALKLKLGNVASDEHNVIGLHKLLGEDLSPESPIGGMVGDYLATKPGNADKIRELCRQIKTIWQQKSHHSDEQEPYKAAERVAILAFEIGAVPCWNCKSGKDRTGMLDSEIKREVIAYQHNGKFSQPGNPFDGNNKELLKEIIMNTGNAEIQCFNTGVKGNKVMKTLPLSFINLSYKKRIADETIANELKGFSELAK